MIGYRRLKRLICNSRAGFTMFQSAFVLSFYIIAVIFGFDFVVVVTFSPLFNCYFRTVLILFATIRILNQFIRSNLIHFSLVSLLVFILSCCGRGCGYTKKKNIFPSSLACYCINGCVIHSCLFCCRFIQL